MSPPSNLPPDRRLLHAALLLSAVSAVVSMYSAFGPPAPAPAAGDPASLRGEIAELRKALDAKADTGQLAASIQRLHARIDQLEARLAKAPPATGAAATPDDERPSPAGSADPSPSSAGEARGTFKGPRFVELQPPAKGIAVKQLEDGSFSVTNTDPALTGRTMLVKGKADDGTERDIAITVPAP